MEKSRIVDALGEEELRLPALLNEALAANDRAKCLFTILQVAQGHADFPDSPVTELRAERAAAGLPPDSFEDLIASASRVADGRYQMPGVERLCTQLGRELATMISPLKVAGAPEAGPFEERSRGFAAMPAWESGDRISGEAIAAITAGTREGESDSAHRLVMDMHKALNALQARISSETVEGAHVYGIAAEDRPLVAAFMRGIRRTVGLKFDHPGLGTTATRSGERLVLQNDIGTTDAHVLVVHVEGMRVTVTYTDVHMQRLVFFQELFGPWKVEWQDTLSRTDRTMKDGIYHLCIGAFAASSRAQLEEYLAFMGSRLVFLIDWNRARKRLRLLLPKKDVANLLLWSAENDYGHMAFLRAGGEQMVFDALSFVARTPSTFGARLDDVLGRDSAVRFMRSVMRICAQGLLGGRPEGLVRDEVRAELVNHFHSAQERTLDLVAEHAAFTLEIACGIRDALYQAGQPEAAEVVRRNAERAKDWERRADELVNRARDMARSSPRARFFRDVVESADDVADALEDAAFHLSLVPCGEASSALVPALRPLAALVVEAVQEYVKAVETARTLHRGSPREDTQDFLEAIHRVMTLERRSDQAHRDAKSIVPAQPGDFGRVFGFLESARDLEGANDSLMHVGLQLRDYVLGEMVVE
jgi:uncharacterized protein Yka (UPF0111/DUF47 family)